MRVKLAATMLIVTGSVACILCAGGNASAPPSLEGTFRLVSRKLPDSTMQKNPAVLGLLTFTKEYRNFNVYWKDANGKSFSIAYAATYKLTDNEYSEKSLYYVVNDESGGKPAQYELSESSGKSPVSAKEGRMEFQFPLHGEPSVVVQGDMLTASRPGAFVDTWERVR